MAAITQADIFFDSLSLDNEHDIDEAIASREQLDQRIHNELVRLRSHRNNTVPIISRIPNEILAEMLTMFVYEARRGEYKPLRWLWVTHVCARWRNIALDIPALWTVIHTGPYQACAERFIELSRDLPLSISPGKDEFHEYLDPKFFAPLVYVTDRVQHMKLYLKRHTLMGLLTFHYRFYDSIALDSALLLETLDLAYTTDEDGDEADSPDKFWFMSRPALLPKLRVLNLRGFPLDFTIGLARPTLTELSVSASMPFDLNVWKSILEKLPLLEKLELEGIETTRSRTSPVPWPRMITAKRLRDIEMSPAEDGDGLACAQLLNSLLIPSSCKIAILQVDERPSFVLDVIASKKDGRGCLGEPQPLTALSVDRTTVRLWSDTKSCCILPLEGGDIAGQSSVVELLSMSDSEELLEAIIDTPTFPIDNIQLLCVKRMCVDTRFLTHFTYLRELHCHRNQHRDMLDALNALAPTALPYLRSLTLDRPKWHAHPGGCKVPFGGEPLSAAIDIFLTSRRTAGVALEELRLHHIRFLDDAQDIPWLQRASTELPVVSWTRWPGKDDCGYTLCVLCGDSWSKSFGDKYE